MHIGIGVAAGPDAHVLGGLGGELERAGAASIWVNDSPMGDGLAQLAVWSRDTQLLDLGVGVLALDRHDPEEIARRVRALELPLGRLWLGIGAGVTGGAVGRVREGAGALRELLPGARLAVAAMRPRMCELAGELGDAVLLNWMTPERCAWARERVEAGAARASRAVPQVMAYVRCAIGPEAPATLRQESLYYGQAPNYVPHFEQMGVPADRVGEAVATPGELPARLARYGALDVLIARVLAPRNLRDVVAVAHAALAPA